MNKTIIININGLIFHIEEDAYELLQNYMNDIKRHFSNTADSMEITGDIENRIAEMFSEIMKRENRQVVVTSDIQEVIAQMGTTADFVVDEEEAEKVLDGEKIASNRRLFRDPDDYLLGGVCSGIANYFDVQAVWIRLGFALTFLAAGTGILVYIILWIVIPKAATRADRMAMKGEKIDLQGFKRNFEEEIKNVQNILSDTHRSAKPFIYQTRDFLEDFFKYLYRFITGAGKIILKIIGVIFLIAVFAAGVVLTGFFIATLVFGKNPDWLFPFNIISSNYADLIYISAYLLALIPLLVIMLFTIRVLFNRVVLNRSIGFAMLVIWLGSFGTLGYYASRTASDFRAKASFSQQLPIDTVPGKTYYLKVNDVKDLSAADSAKLGINQSFKGKIILEEDGWNMEAPRNVRIRFEKADVAAPVLEETFSAKGRTYEDALTNARNTNYRFSQKDSVLTFDNRLKSNDSALWRDQRIYLTLKIPVNTHLVIQEDFNRFEIYGINIWDCVNRDENSSDRLARFLMTENGLQCVRDTVAAKAEPDSTVVN